MHQWASATLEALEMRCQIRWASPLGPYCFCFSFLFLFFPRVCVWEGRESGACEQTIFRLYICAAVNHNSQVFPPCAYRSCITSKAWKWWETWRGSWSRSCSQTQTTPLYWQAGATLPEVFSSRCPSALPLTWSRPSPGHIMLKVARWTSPCQRSRPPLVSSTYWWGLTTQACSGLENDCY